MAKKEKPEKPIESKEPIELDPERFTK